MARQFTDEEIGRLALGTKCPVCEVVWVMSRVIDAAHDEDDVCCQACGAIFKVVEDGLKQTGTRAPLAMMGILKRIS